MTLMRAVVTDQSSSDRGGARRCSRGWARCVFVEAVRRRIDSLPEEKPGGWRERVTRRWGARYQLIHEKPSEAWTLER